MPDVSDFDNELRRVLNDRAAAVHPQLSALDIRNRAASRTDVRIRFAPLLSAAAVAAAAVLVAVLMQGAGSHGEGQRPIAPVASATPTARPSDIVAGCTRPPGVFGDGVRHPDSPTVTLLLADGSLPRPNGPFPALGVQGGKVGQAQPRGNTIVVVGPAKGSTVPRVLAVAPRLKVGDKVFLIVRPDNQRRYEVIDRHGYTRAQGLPSWIFSPPASDQLVLVSCGADTDPETPDHDDIVIVHARPAD